MMANEQIIKVGKIYKHYKGNIYKIIALGKDSETCDDVIIYQSQANGDIWVRPRNMWNNIIDNKGTLRFTVQE